MSIPLSAKIVPYGSNKMVDGKSVDLTTATDGSSYTIQDDDIFLIDDGAQGTEASTYYVTGAQLKTYIGSVTVDSSITDGSTNPVQNNAIHDALDLKLNLSGGTMTGQIDFNNQRAIGFQRVQMEAGGWFNKFIDDDDMSEASNTTVSSSESIKAYVDTTVRDIRSSGFNYGYTGGTKVYIPLGVSTSESTTVVGRNEFANFVVPFDGYLDQVIVRSEEACGSTIVGFHKSVTGVEVPNSTATGTKTVDMAVDDTAYKFDFTRDNTFSAGDIIAISFDPTNDANDTNATVVLVYDVTQGV